MMTESLQESIDSGSGSPEQVVRVDLGERSYDIRVGEGLVDQLGEAAAAFLPDGVPVVVATNEALASTYGERARSSLEAAGAEALLYAVPDGESAKTLQTVSGLLDFLVEKRLPRQTVLFAVGGGVVGDMVGFAAAIYLRGVDYIQVPTSLLAMVDASVGGKTAVNHPKGKNLIGAFYQPRLVAVDLTTLASLPRQHYAAGLGEMVKHGVIRDAELFEVLERNAEGLAAREARMLAPIVARNCIIKADVVKADERESGLRAILNFGHTVGHAVENLSSASGLVHGEAVSIGMVAAASIAVKMEMWSEEESQRLAALLEALGLPVRIPKLPTEAILERMGRDKKIVGRTLRFVLPEAIGRVAIRDDVPDEVLAETIEELKS